MRTTACIVRRFGGVVVALLLAFGAVHGAAQTGGQAHLLRVLRQHDDFRLRVQAALALGGSGNTQVLPHLVEALGDPNPAVRSASAAALGRLGSPDALDGLRRLTRDRAASVRQQAARSVRSIEERRTGAAALAAPAGGGPGTGWASVYPRISLVPSETNVVWSAIRYVLYLGAMDNRSGYRGPEFEGRLRHEVASNLRQVQGVAVMPYADQVDPQDARRIQQRRLPKLRIDGSVTKVDRRTAQRNLSIRCEVSLMLLDQPELAIRGTLSGAATGIEEHRQSRADQEHTLADRVLASAVRSATSNARTAIQSATRR